MVNIKESHMRGMIRQIIETAEREATHNDINIIPNARYDIDVNTAMICINITHKGTFAESVLDESEYANFLNFVKALNVAIANWRMNKQLIVADSTFDQYGAKIYLIMQKIQIID